MIDTKQLMIIGGIIIGIFVAIKILSPVKTNSEGYITVHAGGSNYTRLGREYGYAAEAHEYCYQKPANSICMEGYTYDSSNGNCCAKKSNYGMW